MSKIVLNKVHGGFSLSDQAIEKYLIEKGISFFKKDDYYHVDGDIFFSSDIERTDPILIKVVEELGEGANGYCSNLEVEEIGCYFGSDVEYNYTVKEYDGYEWIEYLF